MGLGGLICLLTSVLLGGSLTEQLFEEKVRPVLEENCASCHGASAVSGLRVTSRDALLKGGTQGPALVPGKPEQSLLLAVIEHRHPKLKMPPGRKLSEPQIAALRKWIELGAEWPERPATKSPPAEARKPLWSLAPLRKPSARSLDEIAGPPQGQPVEERLLLRRLAFDLTGLPPWFEAPFEEAVERLLASPHFGEKWARHWLDVARYAEDDVRGLGRADYPNAWRYRDWVVQAFNEDLPYDQFIRLQIAADLLPRPGKDDRAALGLFGLGPWYYSNAPPPEARADERHDRVDVLTRGFLGLTVGCARCHDHKFDPISMRDYYALAQVFARTQYAEYPLTNPATVAQWDQDKQRIDELEKSIQEFLLEQGKQLSVILARDTARYLKAIRDAGDRPNWRKIARKQGLDEETLLRWKRYLDRPQHEHPFLKDWKTNPEGVQQAVLRVLALKAEIDKENELALAPTRPKRNSPKTRLPNGFETYDEFCPGCSVVARAMERDDFMLWNDLFRTAEKRGGGILFYGGEEIERFLQGEWKAHLHRMRQELASRKQALGEQYPYLHAISEREEPRRLRIHERGNPYNLGEEAPERFLEICGGQPLNQGSGRAQLAEVIATSPLAARVAVNRIWGHLMGQYLVGTPSNFGAMGEPPTNPELLEELAARFAAGGYSVKKLIREIVLTQAYRRRPGPRRLDAEGVRDAMLAVSGLLDRKIGGPSVDLAKDRSRRSIYGRVSRFQLDPSLALFDFPSPSITNEKRVVTQVPLQQLYFLNSSFVAEVAARLASLKDVSALYQKLFHRQPTSEERARAQEFLRGGTLAEYAQVLLISNEFQFVD
ncbi:MAG: PSD1 and planctomycete cytochrome C domain-containing protein [Bryobacteraceae bacterium]|nr:PSD1 and planctomycete cytochrome C domain-containing protein [Bryobacteraceae bacterium]MDW8379749.1 PSD1 and planctomycete cytochrome C domain-containing protein [Bryobacterales bacterium]